MLYTRSVTRASPRLGPLYPHQPAFVIVTPKQICNNHWEAVSDNTKSHPHPRHEIKKTGSGPTVQWQCWVLLKIFLCSHFNFHFMIQTRRLACVCCPLVSKLKSGLIHSNLPRVTQDRHRHKSQPMGAQLWGLVTNQSSGDAGDWSADYSHLVTME